MLENAGLHRIEVPGQPFAKDPAGEGGVATQFAAMIAKAGLETRYALLAGFEGSRARGITGIRAVLVDATGRIVWSEHQQAGEAAFDAAKPREPMSCCVLLVERLRAPLGYTGNPFREGGSGPWARHWEAKSERPDRDELAAMSRRREALESFAGKPTVLVYPARIGEVYDAGSADRIAEQINARGRMVATSVAAPLTFKVTPSSNELKVLWTGARSLKALVAEAKPEADYVLVGDFALGAHKAHAVHWYLLEADGDWVIVDFQNDHHRDFQALDPRTREDCCRLVVTRLAALLE
jgi:hypothetical protein